MKTMATTRLSRKRLPITRKATKKKDERRMSAYAMMWKFAMEARAAAGTPVVRLMTLANRVSRHPNVLAYLIASSGVGISAVQFLAWIKGVEIADHLAYSAERQVASHTIELEETLEVRHHACRESIYTVAW